MSGGVETSSARRPRTLFIAPITPAESGNGLAMRAGLLLEALATTCDVSLLVVPVAGVPSGTWSPFVLERTADRECLPLGSPQATSSVAVSAAPADVVALRARFLPALARAATAENIDFVRQRFAGGSPFDLVLVMRLYLAPFVAAIDGARRTILDLDDDEVMTRRRLAALHGRVGENSMAEVEETEAQKFRILEASWLPLFDRVLVCSDVDRAAVAARTGHAAVEVVPNGVRLPRRNRPRAGGMAGHARLIFVASLGYFPNVDAAIVLCRAILPELASRIDHRISIDLVGSRPAPAIMKLRAIEGVRVHGDVPDVAPFYEQADVAVMPIRAGGGTRLKVLEAFAHDVAVVSTSIGAEGLDCVAGRHLLIADEPGDIADACATLLLDMDLKQHMQSEAFALVQGTYEASLVKGRLLDLVAATLGHESRRHSAES